MRKKRLFLCMLAVMTALSMSACHKKGSKINTLEYSDIIGAAQGTVSFDSDGKLEINIRDIQSYLGGDIDYSSAVEVENADQFEDFQMWVDATGVDIYTVGKYVATYKFIYDGQETEKKVGVTILEKESSGEDSNPAAVPETEALIMEIPAMAQMYPEMELRRAITQAAMETAVPEIPREILRIIPGMEMNTGTRMPVIPEIQMQVRMETAPIRTTVRHRAETAMEVQEIMAMPDSPMEMQMAGIRMAAVITEDRTRRGKLSHLPSRQRKSHPQSDIRTLNFYQENM